MIGKANSIKTKMAVPYYTYSGEKRTFVEMDQAINEALEELNDVSIIDIRYNTQICFDHAGDFQTHDSALIIYRINE